MSLPDQIPFCMRRSESKCQLVLVEFIIFFRKYMANQMNVYNIYILYILLIKKTVFFYFVDIYHPKLYGP